VAAAAAWMMSKPMRETGSQSIPPAEIPVKRPCETGSTLSPPDRFWRRFALVGGLVLLAMILVPVFAIVLAIALPAFQRGRAHATAVNQQIHEAATATRVKVFGTVTDDGKAVPDARVVDSPFSDPGTWLQEIRTDSEGRFELRITGTVEHLLTVSAPGYETNSNGLVAAGHFNKTIGPLEIQLRPIKASAESWSPALAPNKKPDLQRIRDEAKELMEKQHYEESLQRHLWYYNHALEYDPGQAAVRLSFTLSDWVELGRRYPKARQALVEIRDRLTREFQDGRGYSQAFQEVASINQELQEDDATYALLKNINEKDPHLARQCYFYVDSLLVSKGEYQMCLNLMGDPLQRFGLIRLTSGMDRISTNAWTTPDALVMLKKSANERFVDKVRELVEILVATGHKADAEKIRDQAETELDDARLKSAISDAEKKVHK